MKFARLQTTTLGLLATVLGWLVWRRWYRRRASVRLLAAQALDRDGRPLETVGDNNFAGFRTVIGAGLIVVLAAGTAVAATIYLPPTAQRHVLRTAIEWGRHGEVFEYNYTTGLIHLPEGEEDDPKA